MLSKPFYNILDAVQAPARALSAKQVFLMVISLFAGLLVFDFFRYLAYLEQGENLGLVFSLYGFFPFDSPPHGRILAQILFGLGVAGGILCIMFGLFAVSAVHVEAIRGNPFMSAGKAIRFARSRVTQIILSEAAVVIFVGFIILLFTLFGLLARIPVIGDLLFSVFFVIPNFVIALFSVFILFVLSLSILLLPAVAATERVGETFGVILETFSTLIRQPSRWIGYTAVSAALAKVASFVYAYFAFRAVQFIVFATSLGGGDKMEQLVGSGMSHLPTDSRLVEQACTIFPGVKWSFGLGPLQTYGDSGIAGHLMSLMLFLIFASVVGYFLAALAASQVYTYVGIRREKDGHDLASEKPLFFEEEHVNPEVTPSQPHSN
jgi:hypothetical protein